MTYRTYLVFGGSIHGRTLGEGGYSFIQQEFLSAYDMPGTVCHVQGSCGVYVLVGVGVGR